MSTAVAVVLASAAVTMTIKAAGPMLLGPREMPAAVNRVMALLAPALLSALVVTQAVATGRHLVLDARAAGVAAAAVAVAFRAPVLVTVAVAALVTASVRLLIP